MIYTKRYDIIDPKEEGFLNLDPFTSLTITEKVKLLTNVLSGAYSAVMPNNMDFKEVHGQVIRYLRNRVKSVAYFNGFEIVSECGSIYSQKNSLSEAARVSMIIVIDYYFDGETSKVIPKRNSIKFINCLPSDKLVENLLKNNIDITTGDLYDLIIAPESEIQCFANLRDRIASIEYLEEGIVKNSDFFIPGLFSTLYFLFEYKTTRREYDFDGDLLNLSDSFKSL